MAATIRPRRSVLYMPGSNARALEKGRTLPADALILDLEDAVAPGAKEAARAQIVDALAGGGYGQREILVRVNGLDSEWGRDDIAVMAKSGADYGIWQSNGYIASEIVLMSITRLLRRHTQLGSMLSSSMKIRQRNGKTHQSPSIFSRSVK